MKQITELTEKEILALSDDQLQTMVKYKMAEAGIKILTKPVEPTYLPIPPKNDMAFSIGAVNYFTKDEKVAKEIAAVITKYSDKFMSATYVATYENKFLKNLDEYIIKDFGRIDEIAFYTPERVAEAEEITKKNKALKAEYNVSLKEYNDANDQADYIRVDIYGRFSDVINKYDRMHELKRTYSTYLALADNDATIAINFLKKAYSIDYETEYFVQGQDMPAIAD